MVRWIWLLLRVLCGRFLVGVNMFVVFIGCVCLVMLSLMCLRLSVCCWCGIG